ncbi:hypothetical protein [Halodesulfovibrio sp.]|jgi:predicted nuclease with TOPRIM domain|uniref:hypothetical protein n=1 Tax=Halodesulfovibrio sp. TaxID=1912772 RepID=UPI0025DFBE78|nr:hypothetical protein [Halodesulfovibrio sp.]MCT4533897.1 hypothetical protein [Halodesulfovibrio sp.]MCT4628129.1 hypothetical protein [Halodesulfovibrio sp.]
MESMYFIILACSITLILILLTLLKKYNEMRDVLARLETENNGMVMRKESYESEIGSLNEEIAEYTKEYMLLERSLAESRQAETERNLEKERYKYMTFVEYLLAQGYITQEHVTKAEEYRKKNISSMGVAEVLVLFNQISSQDMKRYRDNYRKVIGG